MRSWAMLAVFGAVTGCVVYRDEFGSTDSTWSTDTTSSEPEPESEGQVTVGWRVGSAGCEVAGVETVEVTLGDTTGLFPCADEGATFEAEAGRHPLVLRGLDASGVARYAGDGGTIRVRRGELTTAPTVVLSGLPAQIEAHWSFDNGLLCAANGVGDVEVDLFDGDDTLVASEVADCEAARVRLAEVEAGAYVLVVLGRDPDGIVVYAGEIPVDAGRGDDLDLALVLSPEL